MSKLTGAEYKRGSFCGGNNTINLITYNNKIFVPYKLQKYIVKWYHTYLLDPRQNQTESTILQNLYWPGIRESTQKEVTNFYICQCKKQPTKNTFLLNT